jgi:hypothetical protein
MGNKCLPQCLRRTPEVSPLVLIDENKLEREIEAHIKKLRVINGAYDALLKTAEKKRNNKSELSLIGYQLQEQIQQRNKQKKLLALKIRLKMTKQHITDSEEYDREVKHYAPILSADATIDKDVDKLKEQTEHADEAEDAVHNLLDEIKEAAQSASVFAQSSEDEMVEFVHSLIDGGGANQPPPSLTRSTTAPPSREEDNDDAALAAEIEAAEEEEREAPQTERLLVTS